MIAHLKRHRRFVLVVALTLVGGMAIYSAMVPSAREQARDAQAAAQAAQFQAIDVAQEARQSVPALREGKGLGETMRASRQRLVELEAHKEELLRTLAYQPPAEFRIPAEFEPEQPAEYQRWFDRLLREVQDEFRNEPAYAIVRSPELGAAGLLDRLGFEVYLEEAQAWAGVVEPAPERGGGRGAGPFLVRSQAPRGPTQAVQPRREASEEEELTPEDRAARELEAARAETRMRLVLLSMVTKVIHAGFVEEPLTIERIEFIERGRETSERYRVDPAAACFFRPVRLAVSVEATEPALIEFIRRAVDPGEAQQLLTLDRFRILAEEALLAEPSSDRVEAHLEFLVFLIDPEQPFQEDEQEGQRVGTGPGLPFRR